MHGQVFHRCLARFNDNLARGKVKVPAFKARTSRISVCVRKRPLSRKEASNDCFDVVSCVDAHALVCHEPRTNVDLHKTLVDHTFCFDRVFGEESATADIYAAMVAPEVERMEVALAGAAAGRARRGAVANLTVFAYGQTGSGKTHTMEPIYETAVAAVFAAGRAAGYLLAVSFFEIYQGKAYDLLGARRRCEVQEDKHGNVQIVGMTEVGLGGASEAAGDQICAPAVLRAAPHVVLPRILPYFGHALTA